MNGAFALIDLMTGLLFLEDSFLLLFGRDDFGSLELLALLARCFFTHRTYPMELDSRLFW